MNAPNAHRMVHIDSIRGIAALLVIFKHATAAFVDMPAVKDKGTLLYDIAYNLQFGKTGVIAFFAISGFVICASLKGGKSSGAKNFLISRFFRLYPAFWAAIFLTVLVQFVWMARDIDWTRVFGNAAMLYSAFHVKPFLGIFWTLEVELIFYLLCLLVFLCGWLHKPVMLFLVGLLLMAVFQFISHRPELRATITDTMNYNWIEMPRYLAIMFWGGLFRIWYDDRQKVCSVGGYQIPVIVLVVALLFLILLYPLIVTDKFIYNGNIQYFHLAIPFILGLGLFLIGALYVKLTNAFFVWLGAISYSLYLLHPVAIFIIKNLIDTKLLVLGDVHLSIYLLICTALSLFMAGLVYHFIEKPAIAGGRYLRNRWVPNTQDLRTRSVPL
jgi:peptidoglycan/LPS O-acetylase OafA/YrhL